IMDAGQLVSDDIVDGIVAERLSQGDAEEGYILDGYPRTLRQAHFLERLVDGRPVVVLNIHVGDEALVSRLSGRRTCRAHGHIFHVESSPSAAGDVCDKDGSPLVQRSDDQEEVVRKRLSVYHQTTAPLIDYFRGLPGFHQIAGDLEPDRIFEGLKGIVDRE
ncbi:MAG: nucleoside monophosphate kinase, partial [Acidobacteria bacterium]|nr:nucleoside monophosphate kinase [Acidobacteriota bacterium]